MSLETLSALAQKPTIYPLVISLAASSYSFFGGSLLQVGGTVPLLNGKYGDTKLSAGHKARAFSLWLKNVQTSMVVASGSATLAPLITAYLVPSGGSTIRNFALISALSAFAFFPISAAFFLPVNGALKDLAARADGISDGALSVKEGGEVDRLIAEWDGYQPLRVGFYALAWVTSLAAFTLGVRVL